MLLSEFETLTDIHPDAILYGVIEREYNDGDWQSHAQFCNAYKFDEDGLATKCQRIANDEIWRKDEEYRTAQTKRSERIVALRNECEHFKSEYRNAHDINAELMQRVEELEHEIATRREVMQELRGDKVRADMFRVLEEYVRDDVDVHDIGRAVIAYVDLLDWEECHGDD